MTGLAVVALLISTQTLGQTGPARTRSTVVQGNLNLAARERVVLRLNAQGLPVIVSATAVGPGAALPPGEGRRLAPGGGLNSAEPGTIVMTLGGVRETGSILKIENGLDRAIRYDAGMAYVLQGQVRTEMTNVCSVVPGIVGFEHWDLPIIQIIAVNLRQTDDTSPVCATPIPPAPTQPAPAPTV